jgi:hypothetical protein
MREVERPMGPLVPGVEGTSSSRNATFRTVPVDGCFFWSAQDNFE